MSDRLEFVFVLVGGLMLATIAGYVNTLMIVLGAPPVTHLTGSISRLSVDLGLQDFSDARSVGLMVFAFLLGAMCAGALLGSSMLRLGQRYGVAIMIEAAMLALAGLLVTRSFTSAVLLAAAAAGLQNAMASSYKSMIIRTTHMTGVLTDIGFTLGRIVSGKQRPGRQLLLLALLLVAFVTGGVLGVAIGTRDASIGLWYAAGTLALIGVGYFVLRRLGRIPLFGAR